MSKNNIDVSSDLSSLLSELSQVKKEEQKKVQEKVEKINQDISFASMMAELSEVAKSDKKKKQKLLVEPEKKKEDITTKEEKVGLLSQLSQLAKETKPKEESYAIGTQDYVDHTKEITPGQEKPKKKKAVKKKKVEEKVEVSEVKQVSPIIELTTKELDKIEKAQKPKKVPPSVESLEKRLDNLTKQLIKVSQSHSSGGGAGALKDLDDVDTSTQQNGYAIKYNSSTGKYDFGEVATDFSSVSQSILPDTTNTYDIGSPTKRFRDIYLSSESIDLAGATISSDGSGSINIAATGATLPAGSKAGSNELAVISSSGDTLQAARVIPFFSASGGLSTKNTDFEFNATVDSRFTFTGTKTFTLSNGDALADSDPTLFQF